MRSSVMTVDTHEPQLYLGSRGSVVKHSDVLALRKSAHAYVCVHIVVCY